MADPQDFYLWSHTPDSTTFGDSSEADVTTMPSNRPIVVVSHQIQQGCCIPARSPYTDPPVLYVTEQPKRQMRFRYPTEKGNHGSLTGQSPKSYPAVKLENYVTEKNVYARASLYTIDEQDPKLHFHIFKGPNCCPDGSCSVPFSKENIARFENLKIEYCRKKDAEIMIFERLRKNNPHGENPASLKYKAKEEMKRIDFSKVRICFEALQCSPNSEEYVIARTFSEPIYHQNDPKCCNLRIVRIDKTSSPMIGGEEVFLLCDKVDKNDIEVKFHQYDTNGEVIWEDNGKFNAKADVHHQYAIVFTTPPYPIEASSNSLTKEVEVQVHLYRPSDEKISQGRQFWYKTIEEDELEIKRKRKKAGHFYSPQSDPAELSALSNPSSSECSPQKYAMAQPESVQYSPSLEGTSQNIVKNSDFEVCWKDILACVEPHNLEHYDTNSIDPSFKFDFISDSMPTISDYPNIVKKDEMLSSTMSNRSTDELIRNTTNISQFDSAMPRGGAEDIYKFETDSVPRSKTPNAQPTIDELTAHISKLNVSSETSGVLQKTHFSASQKVLLCAKIMQQNGRITTKDGDGLLHLILYHKDNVQPLTIFCKFLADSHPELINKQNNSKQTPLHIALLLNCEPAVELLLNHGADPNIAERKGNTAFHLAAKRKNVECLKKMTYKAKCGQFTFNDALNDDGYSALHLSIVQQSEECAELLVSAGSDIWLKDGRGGRTPFHMAVLYLPSLMKILISKWESSGYNSNLCVKDYQGHTVIALAHIHKLSEVIHLLEKAYANSLMKNSEDNFIVCDNNSMVENNTVDSETYSSTPESQTDSGFISSNETSLGIVDYATVMQLEKLLNPPNSGWEQLANFAGVEEQLIQDISKLESSPTKALLHLFQRNGRTVEDLMNVLEFAELKDAYSAVKMYKCNM